MAFFSDFGDSARLRRSRRFDGSISRSPDLCSALLRVSVPPWWRFL